MQAWQPASPFRNPLWGLKEEQNSCWRCPKNREWLQLNKIIIFLRYPLTIVSLELFQLSLLLFSYGSVGFPVTSLLWWSRNLFMMIITQCWHQFYHWIKTKLIYFQPIYWTTWVFCVLFQCSICSCFFTTVFSSRAIGGLVPYQIFKITIGYVKGLHLD